MGSTSKQAPDGVLLLGYGKPQDEFKNRCFRCTNMYFVFNLHGKGLLGRAVPPAWNCRAAPRLNSAAPDTGYHSCPCVQ